MVCMPISYSELRCTAHARCSYCSTMIGGHVCFVLDFGEDMYRNSAQLQQHWNCCQITTSIKAFRQFLRRSLGVSTNVQRINELSSISSFRAPCFQLMLLNNLFLLSYLRHIFILNAAGVNAVTHRAVLADLWRLYQT